LENVCIVKRQQTKVSISMLRMNPSSFNSNSTSEDLECVVGESYKH
jgi:hypothetical protein